MKKEMGGKFLFIIILFIFLSSGILATAPVIGSLNCTIDQKTECQSAGDYILMGVSDLTNAHGELANQGNYNYVVCCGFGTGNTTCNPSVNSQLIKLSQATNAHAEIPSGTNYNNNICYEDLYCMGTYSNCGTADAVNYHIGILSLTNTTNAHIGNISDFPVKICCKSSLYGGCTITSANWSVTQASGGQGVWMDIVGSSASACNGKDITFNVSGGSTPLIKSQQPKNVGFIENKTEGKWFAVHQSCGILGTDCSYYFNVSLTKNQFASLSTLNSPKLVVTSKQDCSNILTCGDYTTQTDCESDATICNVAQASSLPGIDCTNPSNNCRCIWDNTTTPGTCGFGWSQLNASNSGDATSGCNYGFTLCYNATSGINYCNMGASCPSTDGPPTITTPLPSASSPLYNNQNGSCDFGIDGCLSSDCQDGDQGTCAAGLYCSSGVCSNAGGPQSLNSSLNIGSCKIIQTITKDCTVAPVGFKTINWSGTWLGGTQSGPAYQKCITGGETTVACPAQIQLPFFNYVEIITTLIVIALIYVSLSLRKKSKGKKKRK